MTFIEPVQTSPVRTEQNFRKYLSNLYQTFTYDWEGEYNGDSIVIFIGPDWGPNLA